MRGRTFPDTPVGRTRAWDARLTVPCGVQAPARGGTLEARRPAGTFELYGALTSEVPNRAAVDYTIGFFQPSHAVAPITQYSLRYARLYSEVNVVGWPAGPVALDFLPPPEIAVPAFGVSHPLRGPFTVGRVSAGVETWLILYDLNQDDRVLWAIDSGEGAETITIPWDQVNQALPGARLQQIEVKDAAGQILPYQVTNVAPQAKDPNNMGIAYGELIFQHDFAVGEQSATFTVEPIDGVAPVFPTKVFARYIPERLDDFAWENDKIAHRTYGPALAAARAPGSGKEVLVSSGLDVWSKRVAYPVVDRWYNKGHDHYHHDNTCTVLDS